MGIPIENVQFDAPKPTGIPIENVKFDEPASTLPVAPPEPRPFSMEGAISGDMSGNAEASQAVAAVATGLNPLVPAVTGFAGLAGAVAGIPWRKGGETASKWMEAVQPYITVPLPKTKEAEMLSSTAGAPFEFLHEKWGVLGDQFVDNPILAASIATIGEAATYAALGKITHEFKAKNAPFNADIAASELAKEITKNTPKTLAEGDKVVVSGQEYAVRSIGKEGAVLADKTGAIVNVAAGDRFKAADGSTYEVPKPAEAGPAPLQGTAAVDEAGNVKRLYHGTNAEFDQFDPSKASPDSLYTSGFYATDATLLGDEYAFQKGEQGANVRPIALDIKNPINMDAPPDSRLVDMYVKEKATEELNTWNRHMGVEEGKMGQTDAEIIAAKEATIRQDIANGEPSIPTNGKLYRLMFQQLGGDMIARLKSLGYDGVTHVGGQIIGDVPHQVWVAWDPHQVVSWFDHQKALDEAGRAPSLLANESGQAQIISDAAKALLETKTAENIGKMKTEIKAAIAPATIGEGKEAAGIIREKGAAEHVAREQMAQKFERFGRTFKNMSEDARLRLIDIVEHGASTGDASIDAAFKTMRDVREGLWEKIQEMKGTDAFIEDYFPHFWEDPDVAKKVLGRSPLEGPASFLKERTIPTVREGMDAGLKLKTTNPVELEALKIQEMLRFIKGQEIFTEFKETGIAKYVKFGGEAPEGYVKLNDKIAKVLQYSEAEKGMILRGEYYAPADAARVFNNYLSPGLWGRSTLYNVFRTTGNFMNQVQLGLSAFHFTFTAVDAITSQFALGMQEFTRGQYGAAAKHIASAVTPGVAPISVYLKGSRFLKGALNADPVFAEHLQALVEGGGRLKMDSFYKNSSVENFWKAMDEKHYGSAAWSGVPALIQTLAKPVMEHWVPRMKLGLFTEMVESQNKFWESQNHIPDLAERRAVYGKIVDSVENRMGQLTYDNLFWNKTLKDVSMASVRSLGWNIGTIRELGGGIKDIGNLKDIKANGISARTAYVVALPAVVAIYGSMYMYLKTGEGPQTPFDAIFPKTGKQTPDGRDERVSIPSYLKDVYAYTHDLPGSAITTLGHKLHPILAMLSQLNDNRDYYGVMIRNSEDPAVKQLSDIALFMGKQFIPFSVSGGIKRAEQDKSAWDWVEGGFGIMPAPKATTQTPAEVLLDRISANHREAGAITREEWLHNQSKNDLLHALKDRTSGNLVATALESGVQPGELAAIIRNSTKPHEVIQLIKATPREAMMVWKAANSAERKMLYPIILRKIASNKALSPQDRMGYINDLRDGRSQ